MASVEGANVQSRGGSAW
uniref:Uncharacterized protein n=1 Tax=Arundo donax TaxID=35708 RepID=A0A0A8Z6X5_ARUDO